MIHDQQTIDRIRELLELSQIRDEDILEEMTDHYLSEIERQVAAHTNHQAAIRSTFQHIASFDYSTMSTKQDKKNRFLILILALAILFSAYISRQHSTLPIHNQTEKIEHNWPDGWPLVESSGTIAAQFGKMNHPILNRERHHKGIDIKAQKGTAVIATGDAIVQEVGYTEAYGHYIILQHNDRYTTRYCHLSAVEVLKDDQVNKGVTIGAVGSSERTISPHLHYEIIDGDAVIDPLECIRA